MRAAPTAAPGPGKEMQHIGGDTGGVKVRYSARRDQRRLLGGLRHHGVAGGERARDLAGEDRQWKVPGRDAGEHATPVEGQLVPLSGRALQLQGYGEAAPRFRRRATEMIHGLTQIALRVGKRLSRFAHQQRHQRSAVRLEQVGGAFEEDGTRLAAERIPVARGAACGGQRRVDGRRARAVAWCRPSRGGHAARRSRRPRR